MEAAVNIGECFADCVAKLSHANYLDLPKTGKPQTEQEWTLLSTVLQANTQLYHNHNHCKLKVVALGTGTKCIGASKMSNLGDVVNDSHAEVIARRAFLRYLYHQVMLAKQGDKSSILQFFPKEGKFKLLPGFSFHFYTSHTPCGDATIFPRNEIFCDIGECILQPGEISEKLVFSDSSSRPERSETMENESRGLKRSHSAESFNTPESEDGILMLQKKLKQDIHRTGAKCLPTEDKQDLKLPGLDYHVLGAVRTKPGRGDPTLSVSCSDKLMRWNCVGIQGALLSRLLFEPIYLQSITVGGGSPFSESALRRALISRVLLKNPHLPPGYSINSPQLYHSTVVFPYGRRANSVRPCPSSIVWCSVSKRCCEVAVEGRKHGVTKKNMGTPAARLLISKKELFGQFLDCSSFELNERNERELSSVQRHEVSLTKPNFQSQTYLSCKLEARPYRDTFHSILKEAGLPWTKKPSNFENFTFDV